MNTRTLVLLALAACHRADPPGDGGPGDDDDTTAVCTGALTLQAPVEIVRTVEGDAVTFAVVGAVTDPCSAAPRSDRVRVTLTEPDTGVALGEAESTDGALSVALPVDARSLRFPFRAEWACRLQTLEVHLEAPDLALVFDGSAPVTDGGSDPDCAQFGAVSYDRLDLDVDALGVLTGEAGFGQIFVFGRFDPDLGIEAAIGTDATVDIVDTPDPTVPIFRLAVTSAWRPDGDLRATYFVGSTSLQAIGVSEPSMSRWQLVDGSRGWSRTTFVSTTPNGLADQAPDAGYVFGAGPSAAVVADREVPGTVWVVPDALDIGGRTFRVPTDATAWITGIEGADLAPTQFYVDARVLVVGAPLQTNDETGAPLCGGPECGVVAVFDLPLGPGAHDLFDADTVVVGTVGSHAGAVLARSLLCPEGFLAPDYVAPDGGRGAAVFGLYRNGRLLLDDLPLVTGEPGTGALDGMDCWGSDRTGGSFGVVRGRRVRTDTGDWEGAQYLVSVGADGNVATEAEARFAGSGGVSDGGWVGHVDGEGRIFLLPELLRR